MAPELANKTPEQIVSWILSLMQDPAKWEVDESGLRDGTLIYTPTKRSSEKQLQAGTVFAHKSSGSLWGGEGYYIGVYCLFSEKMQPLWGNPFNKERKAFIALYDRLSSDCHKRLQAQKAIEADARLRENLIQVGKIMESHPANA